MFLSAKAYFTDNTANNARLLIRGETAIPQEFIKRYKKNVVKITPMKTGALRRSIITNVSGNQGEITWRSRYAAAQNAGGHTVGAPRVVNIDGRFVTINAGFYRYQNYTTPGTGPHFANIAYKKTQAEMPAVLES